jgi:GntR family transcriptional repressor for pyruvate dehydrogenase complex
MKERSGRPANATSIVVENLLRLLRSGSYDVGDRLPSETELARLCSVGRSAVREGIRDVMAMGLVEVQPGKGTFVQALRPDLLIRADVFSNEERTTLELLEVRHIFEPGAAALAALRATAGEIAQLRRDAEMLEEAVALGFRPPEDLGFHLDVIRAAHNSSLLRLGGAVVSYYAKDETLPGKGDIDDHWAIFAAIERRDQDGARQAMSDHLARELEKRKNRITALAS